MIFKYLKKKLGVDTLEQEVLLLKRSERVYQLKLSRDLQSISLELSELQTELKTKITTKQSLRITIFLIDKVRKRIDELGLTFEEHRDKLQNQIVINYETIQKQLSEVTLEVQNCQQQIKEVQEKKIEYPIDFAFLNETNTEIQSESISHNLNVLDGNYLRALLQNKVPVGYNSSEIKNIPNNYTLETPSNFKKMVGVGNRHCYDNAIIYRRSTNYIIHIGLIFPKQLLQKIFEGKEGLIAITPYLHAWNVTELGKIADYTLGDKRGEEFVYIGRPLVDITCDLEAKDIEQILRNETM